VVSVGDDKKSVGDIAATFIIQEAKKAIATTGRFTVAFSGGSLPKIVGPSLVEKKVENMDKWFVFFSDERCVKLSSDDSNYKSVHEFVLDPLKIPEENVITIDPNEYGDAEKAAKLYEESITGFFKNSSSPPVFDLILLGMGPDGHTCSLFPKHKLLAETKATIAPIADSPKPPSNRITFTYPVLDAAKAVAFVCCGGGKSGALKTVIEGAKTPDDQLPSGRIKNKRVFWYVDKAAAAELKEESIQSKI